MIEMSQRKNNKPAVAYRLLGPFLRVMLICTVNVYFSSVIFVWSYKVVFSES